MVTHCKRLLTTPSLGIFSTFPTLKIFKSNDESSFPRVTGFVHYFFAAIAMDNIDVGDGCWKRNVLAKTARCWWQFWSFGHKTSTTSTIYLHWRREPTFKICHQHRNSVTNIHTLSPTSLSPIKKYRLLFSSNQIRKKSKAI